MNIPALYYALLAAGVLAAALFFAAGLKRRRLQPLFALPASVAGLLLAFVLGKLLYLVFHLELASLEGAWLRLDPTEFSFTGCLAGFALGVLLTARVRKLPAAQVMDCFAVPLCVLAAFVRFAEIFAGELGLAEMATFGLEEISDGSLLAFFPLAIRDQWGMWLFALSTLETLGALFAAFLVIRRRARSARNGSILRDGMLFELALYVLCLFGMFFETAKIISVVFYFVHLEQLFSVLVMLVLLVRLCCLLSRTGRPRPWLPLVFFLLCIALNGFAQYFMDKAWQFYEIIPENIFSFINDHLGQVCYGVMLLTVVLSFFLYDVPFQRVLAVQGENTHDSAEN